MSPVILSLLTSIAIFGILSVSLGLMAGHLGIFSMAHAALFGIGSYTSAFLTVELDWGFIPAGLMALIVAGLAGAVMAIPSLRVSGDYFLVASFALQVVAGSIFENWTAVTGGTAGVPGILRPEFGPLEFYKDGSFLTLCVLVLIAITGFTYFLVHSPYGRMLHVIRDDETVAATMGKSIAKSKITVTVVSGGFAGAAGVLYGQYLMYISPDAFQVATFVSIITMIVVGGMTSVLGTLAGAVIITLIPEIMNLLQMPTSVAGPMEQVAFGLLLIALMFFRPQGLFGELPRRRNGRPTKSFDSNDDREVAPNAS